MKGSGNTSIRALLCVALFGVAQACDGAPSTPAPLVDNNSWLRGGEETDPLRSHAPDAVICPVEAVRVDEQQALDVDTGDCNYLTLVQPALRDAWAGSIVQIDYLHLTLFNPDEDESRGHIALTLNGAVSWERWVDIPSEAAARRDSFVLNEDIRRGTELGFHLHNHGANEWKLMHVTLID